MAFQSYSVSNPASILSVVTIGAKPFRTEGNRSAVAFRVRCGDMATPATASSSCSRCTANYQPNLWDYHSLQLLSSNIECMDEISANHFAKLKKDVRHLLYKESKLVAQLKLVDILQHLGLSYLFEKEIKDTLGSISIKNASKTLAEDLHATALLFRLLRENRIQVSQDIFNGFRDGKGSFKACLYKDAQGMLSLYEASHLAFEGEKTLDEARVFTARFLNDLKSYMDTQLKEKVCRALELPLHRRTPRLEVKWYIDHYKKNENIKPIILQLAKINFNRVQSIHREELKRMARWWKYLGVAEELPFVRDRLVECFFFATGVVFEPNLGYCREGITKVCNIITTLDDVFDIYGSLEELVLFTDAVDRWEFSAVERLPEYMKTCYSILYDTTNEMAYNILRRDGQDILPYLKRAWADLCYSFLVEAKWKYNGYFPMLQEYMDNGWMSASGNVILFHAFILSRQSITEETMHCLENYPNFIRSSSTIFRLCNDLATSTAELERGDAPTSILCYMHEYGVTEEVAREAIKNLINDTWKKLNKEVVDCSPFHRSFADAAINLVRISHCTYQNGDGVGAPDQEKKNQIISTFLKPITIK